MPAPKKRSNPKLKNSKTSFRVTSRQKLLAFILIFAAIGSFLLWKSFAATGTVNVNAPAVSIGNAGGNGKYWIATTDGGIFTEGGATFYGSMGGKKLAQPIVSMAVRPQHDGYWLLGGDGGLFAFGGAKYLGGPNQTTDVGFYRAIVPTPSGAGYWVINKFGAIYPFGDAVQDDAHGISTSIAKFNTGPYSTLPNVSSIISATASASGYGLALLSTDGAVYSYGDMGYHGGANTGALSYGAGDRANTIINNGSNGYLIIANSGAVFAYGATYINRVTTNAHITSAAYTPDHAGYWLLGSDGAIYAFGSAQFDGRISAPLPPPPPPTPPTPKPTPKPTPTKPGSPSKPGTPLPVRTPPPIPPGGNPNGVASAGCNDALYKYNQVLQSDTEMLNDSDQNLAASKKLRDPYKYDGSPFIERIYNDSRSLGEGAETIIPQTAEFIYNSSYAPVGCKIAFAANSGSTQGIQIQTAYNNANGARYDGLLENYLWAVQNNNLVNSCSYKGTCKQK